MQEKIREKSEGHTNRPIAIQMILTVLIIHTVKDLQDNCRYKHILISLTSFTCVPNSVRILYSASLLTDS